MGRLGKVLSVEADGIKCDVNVGVLKADYFASAGDDSPPLPTDVAVLLPVLRSGRHAAIGFHDGGNAPEAEPGEKRLYARDSSGGTICSVWLKANGSILISNDAGDFTLEAGGDIVLNGVRFSPGGIVSGINSLEVGGRELNNHTHPVTTAPGTTGPNT